MCDEHVGLDSCSVACQVCEAWHHISCTNIQIQVSIDNDNLILGKKYLGEREGPFDCKLYRDSRFYNNFVSPNNLGTSSVEIL